MAQHWLVGSSLLAVVLCTIAARADDDKADKSGYSLINPTPDKDLRELSPDRPGKITVPFTVDAGRLQIESDFINYERVHMDGEAISAIEALDPTLKLGVLPNVDVEMNLNGFESVRERADAGTRKVLRLTGFGDVFFRAKVNLFGNDGGDYALAVIPYIKLPSSTAVSLALGDGVVEGGGIATAQIKLPGDFELQLQTEVDALEGGMDSRRHANFVDIVNVAHDVPGVKNLTASAELFTSLSTDRFTPDLYTADLGLEYTLNKSTQLDVGANFGLNKAAPHLQLYTGVSERF